eukprot:6815025-Prymnesium_polylepis.1
MACASGRTRRSRRERPNAVATREKTLSRTPARAQHTAGGAAVCAGRQACQSTPTGAARHLPPP